MAVVSVSVVVSVITMLSVVIMLGVVSIMAVVIVVATIMVVVCHWTWTRQAHHGEDDGGGQIEYGGVVEQVCRVDPVQPGSDDG